MGTRPIRSYASGSAGIVTRVNKVRQQKERPSGQVLVKFWSKRSELLTECVTAPVEICLLAEQDKGDGMECPLSQLCRSCAAQLFLVRARLERLVQIEPKPRAAQAEHATANHVGESQQESSMLNELQRFKGESGEGGVRAQETDGKKKTGVVEGWMAEQKRHENAKNETAADVDEQSAIRKRCAKALSDPTCD